MLFAQVGVFVAACNENVLARGPPSGTGGKTVKTTVSGTLELANQAALLAAIVESSDDAIVSKDLQGVVTSWNPAAVRIFGFTAEEAIGRPLTETIIPLERYEEERRFLETIARGERLEHFETVRRRKDGSLVEVSVTISPIRQNGVIIGASKIARDISDKIRLTRNLNEAVRELELFSARESHDLRAPLRVIYGFIDVVLQDYSTVLPPDGRALLERAAAAARRVTATIEERTARKGSANA